MRHRLLMGTMCLSIAAFGQNGGVGNGNGNGNVDIPGNGQKVVHETKNFAGGATSNSPIVYHGGPILATPTVYIIWYGSWSVSDPAIGILTNLVQHIGGTPYFNINTTYSSSINGVTTPVSGNVGYATSIFDAGSQGTSLTDAKVQAVVSSAITSGKLPKDTNGVYFVLTSAEIKETSGFCTQYCGWHTRGTISGSDIKYAFVGNPATQCPASCAQQTASSPNNNVGADAMASVVSHELEEATTDPDLNAWYDRRGYENADKCAWTFGTTSKASNGSLYNVTIGGLQYLIQRNWVNAGGGYCDMQYSKP